MGRVRDRKSMAGYVCEGRDVCHLQHSGKAGGMVLSSVCVNTEGWGK